MLSVPAATFYRVDPLQTKQGRAVLYANDPGHSRAPSPLLVIAGTADTTVVPARVDAFFQRSCRVGQVTELRWLAGANHGTEVGPAWASIGAWVGDRLAGRPPVDSCRR